MNQSQIKKIRDIAVYMRDIGWHKKIVEIKQLQAEINNYGESLKKDFTKLCVLQIDIAELKYTGYVDLSNNAYSDNPQPFEPMLENNLKQIRKKEEEIKETEYKISELMFMISDLLERINKIGELPKTAPPNLKCLDEAETA